MTRREMYLCKRRKSRSLPDRAGILRRCCSRAASPTRSSRRGSGGASAGCLRHRSSRTSVTGSRSPPVRCSSRSRRAIRSSSRPPSSSSGCRICSSASRPGRSPIASIVAGSSRVSTSRGPRSSRYSPRRSRAGRSASSSSSVPCSSWAQPRSSRTSPARACRRKWSSEPTWASPTPG